jgi:deoxyribodipyrimidine photo-lyase
MTNPCVIHWFRRDLRLSDNLALNAALGSGAAVVPLFIFDPALLDSPNLGIPRLAFMLKGLNALDASLREKGSGLLIRWGDPIEILPKLVDELQAQAIYFNRDYSPYARRRDAAIEAGLPVPAYSFDDPLLRVPGQVVKGDGSPYVVYTPFKERWLSLPHPFDVQSAIFRSSAFHSLEGLPNSPIPDLADLDFGTTIEVPTAGEAATQEQLERFMHGPIYRYTDSRNSLIANPFEASSPSGTSGLGPYLRFGMLSPRQAYWAGREALETAPDERARQGVLIWINELIWREFFVHILYHFPQVARGNFRPQYDTLPWRDAPDDLHAWKTGQTGFPIIDAAMRQLTQIGWIPNRARMIVASFLTKDLLIHWQEGERHFMRWLIDGDSAVNNGNWQWAAGTGTDAQPYFRIFNPVEQSRKYDPTGEYIRRWVRELADVPTRFIHAPWLMPSPPASYPRPIVDHALAREHTLSVFKALKSP